MKRIRVPLSYPASRGFDGASQAACQGGSFAVESVAAFAWNGWQASSGISGNLGLEYAPLRLAARCSIRQACVIFSVSESCYRYRARLSSENAEIADLLVRLTHNQRNWGFGLCFLYLRNVKGYPWNHKRVYRIYRELELNLRIKPRKRLVREKPEPLAVPAAININWSMDIVDPTVKTIGALT